MKIVSIKWLDAKGVTSNWEFKEDIKEMLPAQCCSVGFVERETKEYITIYQTNSKEQVCGRMTILKASIVKKRILR